MVREFPRGRIHLRGYGELTDLTPCFAYCLGKSFLYFLGNDMFAKGGNKVLDTPCYHDTVRGETGEHDSVSHVVAP